MTRLVEPLTTTGPGVRQHIIRTQRERQFFANISTLVIDNRQAIGIRILRETNVGPVAHHGVAESGEIFFDRLRNVFKPAVRISAEDRRMAAERFQKSWSPQCAGPMVAIEDHLQSPLPNRRAIDQLANSIEVCLARVRRLGRRTKSIPPHERQRFCIEQLDEPLARGLVEDRTFAENGLRPFHSIGL